MDPQAQQKTETADRHKSGRKKWMIPLLIALAVLLAACVLIYVNRQPGTVSNYADPEFEAEQTEPGSSEEESGVQAGIQIPGYSEITIPAGETEVELELLNPDENNVYFRITFYLPATDEVIYTSKLIQPGQHLYSITLDRALEAGEYDLTIQYATFTADEAMEPRNGAEVNCRLIAQ